MQTLQEYKCPCCGGAIAFDSGIQKMKCPYCDTEFDMETLASYDDGLNGKQDNMNWETSAGGEWQEGETDGLRSYVCKSCGGEIVGDENTAATACPFCGNPVVMMGQLSGELKPDFVIPFKLDKKAAKAGLQKHLTGKRLLPKIFKDQNHIDEIKGIYVPFWLFDTEADAQVRYRATKVRTWSDSDYDYTETSHFLARRGGSIAFENVPVDGSSKMADDLMESIEPYNFADAVDFQTAYLAGYFADKYDVTAEQSVERANERVKRSTEEAFASTVQGYATVTTESSNIELHGGKAKYALYPVWLLNTTWNGNKYTFAMNGQTGKFVGDLPVDKAAARKWTLGLTAVCSVAAYAVIWLLHIAGII
jgi:DNA-directed RNA polymerase subunit RPC12/RpoP